MGKLTAKAVEKTTKEGMHNDGDGLYLRVTDTGAKGWLFRFKLKGKARAMGLGSFPVVMLADAREKAAEARKLTRAGVDPIEAKKAAEAPAKTVTFDEAIKAYVEAHKAGWKSQKTVKRWLAASDQYMSPVFGNRDVATITTDHVLRVLSPVWATKNETASKLRERIEAVLSWAKVKGYRSGPNPALWRDNLEHLLPSRKKIRKSKPVKHHAALPWQDVPEFMAELRTRGALSARALEITLLCGTRTSETIAAVRSERSGDLWVIPGLRMKADDEHRIPLSKQAAAIFDALPVMDDSFYIFPGHKRGRPLSNMAMLTLLTRMGRRYDITVHGFRSTFRDWAAEQTDFPREIAEMCLAHKVGDEVERAYRRSDLLAKRRALMQAWADFATGIPSTSE